MQLTEKSQTRTEAKRKPKSLSADWPLDLGKYFYTLDIDPGYEMEDVEYEVVGKSGGYLIVRKHNDWPAISGHYYQDHYDEYIDDPEDEFRFPPEIFDANDE